MDPKKLKALGSVFRVEILDLIARGEITSPKRLAIELGLGGKKGLSKTSYNVVVLKEAGLIEEAKTKSVRGAIEHFYRVTLPVKSLKWVPTVLDSAGHEEVFKAVEKCVVTVHRAHEKSAKRLAETGDAGLSATVVVANFASKERPDAGDQ